MYRVQYTVQFSASPSASFRRGLTSPHLMTPQTSALYRTAFLAPGVGALLCLRRSCPVNVARRELEV